MRASPMSGGSAADGLSAMVGRGGIGRERLRRRRRADEFVTAQRVQPRQSVEVAANPEARDSRRAFRC